MSARYLLSAFSSVALLGMAVPALSADVEPEKLSAWSGQVEAWLGYMFFSDDRDVFGSEDDDTDDFTFGVDGKLRIDLSENLSVQADASYADAQDDYSGNEGTVLFGGHLSWSDPDSFLIGAFGAWSDGDANFGQSYEAWAIGGEAQIYLDELTLYGQLGYMDSEETDSSDPEDTFHNAYFGRVVGRYFLDPETRLQAEFLYANGDQDTPGDVKDMDVFGWGARADHQIIDMMSVFVAYNGHYYDNGNGPDTGEFAEHVIRGGVSLAFGRPDLLSVDRTGTNLDLPQIGYWAGAGISVD